MKILHQSCEFVIRTPCDPIKMISLIERAGRTCYKSEDKITKDSAMGFVKNMLKSGHHSVLEHSNIVFRISLDIYNDDELIVMLGERLAFHQIEIVDNHIFINGNLRAWLDTFKNQSIDPTSLLYDIHREFVAKFGFLFINDHENVVSNSNFIKIIKYNDEIPVRLRKYTTRHITNRAMTHEWVRHRIDSAYSQESQRYVANDSDIQFIIPVWATDLTPNAINTNLIEKNETAVWLNSMEAFEKVYHALRKIGLKPQQCREVLPNSCKTEIVTTRGFDAWIWFFHLRNSKAADPQMMDLAGSTMIMFLNKIQEFSSYYKNKNDTK
jgi:thymidylate synthase (FAD)